MRVESPQVESQITASVATVIDAVQRAAAGAVRLDPLLGVVQVRQLLLADRQDDVAQLRIARLQEMQLVVEMAMHRRLDRRGADPDRLAAHQRGEEPSSQPPQLHSDMIRHGRELRSGMAPRNAAQWLLLVRQHLAQGRHDVGIAPRRHRDLRRIDADRAELAGVVRP